MDQNDATRWTNLGASLLIILAGGTVYAFGAYSEALKRKLHLTQAQLELAALCGNLGNYLGTAGFFYDRYGAVASAKFGATLIGLGYGLQWLLCVYFESEHAIEFLCVFCFVWGHGSGYLDCAAIGSGVRAFPRRRGAVVGLLKSFYGLASSLIILGAAPWLSGVNFIVALAVFAGGLPLLALCKFEDVPDRAPEGDAVDAVAAGVLSSLSMRVVGFALLALCIAVLRVIRPPSALGFNVAFSLVIAVGLAWIVRTAARPRPASCVFSARRGRADYTAAPSCPSVTRRRRRRPQARGWPLREPGGRGRRGGRPRGQYPGARLAALRDPRIAELLAPPPRHFAGHRHGPHDDQQPGPDYIGARRPGVDAKSCHGRRERR